MQKLVLLFALGNLTALSAQQFNGGATNTTSDIYRSGNTGLGQTTGVILGAKLHIFQNQGTSAIGSVTYTPTTDLRLERRIYSSVGLNGATTTTRYWDINNTGTNLSFMTGTSTAMTSAMEISSTGIGIGITAPKAALQIGDKFTIHNGTDKIIGYNFYNNGSDRRLITTEESAIIRFDENGNISFQTAPVGTSSNSTISTWTNALSIKNNGSVCIGETNNTSKSTENGEPYRLFVKGGILAQELSVKIQEGSFPDYVFDDDYKLPDLDSVEQFIKTEKHLPNIPSAQTIEQNGLELKQITILQQEKIEELYLYLIELKKTVAALKTKLATFDTKIEATEPVAP